MKMIAIFAAGVLAAASSAAETFRVVQWNIGHFAMGKASRPATRPEDSAARAAEYRAKIAELDADFIGVSEYDPLFDKAGTPTTNAVFASYPTQLEGPKNDYQSNAIFSRLPCVRHEVVDYDERAQKTYFIDAVFMVGTNEVHFVQSHLDWNMNEKATDARPRQIRQLINRYKDLPYVIICADFNVGGAGEYYPFLMAGFKLANCGEAGYFKTYDRAPSRELMPCRRNPLDNIVVKGFKIRDVKLDDVDMKLSDHRIISCTLEMPTSAALPGPGVAALTDGWEFRREGGEWGEVAVPHDWAISGPFDREIDKQVVQIVENQERKATEKTGRTGSLPWIGRGEYRRRIRLDAETEWAALEFDGAMSEPEVFLDGERIGGWKYGYTPFAVEIPAEKVKAAKERELELVVKLENRPLSSRWYPGAGLYRPVRLRQGRAFGVRPWGQSIYTPDLGTVVVDTELRNPGGLDLDVEYAVKAPSGVVVARGKSPLRVANAKPWSPETPVLYTLETTVRDVKGGATVVETAKFGIRTVEYGPDFFKLNGVKRKFRGVCLHHDLGPLGAAFNESAFRRQVRLLKDMGCDSIRTSHNIPSSDQLAICDEEGMMVMAESFDTWEKAKVKNGYNLFYGEWWKRDLEQLVRVSRSHPSVVMWSIGNEVPDQRTPRGAELTKEMQDFIHTLDPDKRRLCTQGASDMPTAIKSGVIAAMEIPAVTYRLPFYGQIHGVDESKPMLGAETASTVSSRGVYKFPDEPRKMAMYDDGQCSGYDTECCVWSNLPDDDWAMQDDNAWTIGEFVWTGFDYLGEPTPYDTYWPSRSSYFGIFDLAGIPKDRAWLYRARWNESAPTLHVVPHWTWPGREGEKTPVYVYTSYPSAEVFVNGKSQGRKTFDRSSRLDRYRLRWRDVVYEPGELKVVAYGSDGQVAATEIVRTAGAPSHLVLEQEPHDSKPGDITPSLVFVNVKVVDKDGNLCPDAAVPLNFKVTGNAVYRAACNGDATSLEVFTEPKMTTFKGRLVVVVEEKGGVRDWTLRVAMSNGTATEMHVIGR